MAVVMVVYDFEHCMLLYMSILINKHCQLLINIHLDCHLNEVFIVIIITLWVNVTCAILDRNTR